MRRSRGGFLIVMASLLLASAIIGYFVGHRGSVATPREGTRSASSGSLLLTYPARWRVATGAPRIPGLSINDPLVLAPGGNAASAGLIAGKLVGLGPDPLGARFVTRLHELPTTNVVNLLDAQAYRYSGLLINGFDRMLTLYVIPNRGGEPTAVACYAASQTQAQTDMQAQAYMHTCDQIVATLSLAAQTQIYENVLTPDSGYAHTVNGYLREVSAQGAALTRGAQRPLSPPQATQMANSLARSLDTAAESLATLLAPPPAAEAQTRLLLSLRQARDAYTALASAASAGDPSGYADAQTRVTAAQANVTRSLRDFALLGYA
jgi:hypothetical protein